MTAPRTGRRLVDYAMAVEEMDEHGLRVAMGYLIGASARAFAVRKAFEGALDAARTDAQLRSPADEQREIWRSNRDDTERRYRAHQEDSAETDRRQRAGEPSPGEPPTAP